MERVGCLGQELKRFFLDALDKDTEAFNQVMAATRLPKESAEDQKKRGDAIEAANQLATRVPLSVLEKSLEVLPLLELVFAQGNRNCLSDVGVAVHCLLTCAEGAAMNVKINLKSFNESSFFKRDCLERMNLALGRVRTETSSLLMKINEIL